MKRLNALIIVCSFFLILFPTSIDASTLQFIETKKDIAVGEETTVSIELNPQGIQILGVDIVLLFDPKVLSIKDIRDNNLFNKKTAQLIDSQKGLLKVAFTNDKGFYVTKKGTVGVVVLEGKSETKETALTYQFTKGETIDSNVTGNHGVDYLTSVNSLVVSIHPVSSQTPTPTPSVTISQTETVTPTRTQGKNRTTTPTKSQVSTSVLGETDEESTTDTPLDPSTERNEVQNTTENRNTITIVLIVLLSLFFLFFLFYFAKKHNKVK